MRTLDPASTPEAIEKKSFAIIDREIPEPRPFIDKEWEIARRCIHALGDIEIVSHLKFSPAAVAAGLKALKKGCVIYTDTTMLASGLVARRMDPLGVKVRSLMKLNGIDLIAKNENITRARVGIKIISKNMGNAIVAIGNAPTALLALLEELANPEIIPPALVIGMPVGFVNASQSKELLANSTVPHITLLGRKGGSAAAAAAVNALAEMALADLRQN